MKILHYILGIAASLALILVLLISSFEIAAYSNFGWYEKEYEKYQVLDDLEMEMKDVMEVTEEMMAYLRGDREDLVVYTTVNGEEREFFNDREKAHMVDVQELFLGGIMIRRTAAVLLVLILGVLFFMKADRKRVLPISFLTGIGSFLAITGIGGWIIMSDFHKYFTIFHHIFFDNDLWLLDPKTDLMIRMLPQGFFSDMVVKIGIIFAITLGIFMVLSIISLIRGRNKNTL